jgi:radical SAM family protein
MMEIRPERLNLAVAHRCFVACRGCYQFFGRSEPNLRAIEASVARFVRLGVTAVTLSGGDPLTLQGLAAFLESLRAVGVTDIKLDTVGTGLLEPRPEASVRQVRHDQLQDLLARVNYLGLPLDGWSNDSVRLFRAGRTKLYDEMVALLDAIDAWAGRRLVVINTVVHRLNWGGLLFILQELSRHASITHWNLFQYTPTDQVADQVNAEFAIDEPTFAYACAGVLEAVGNLPPQRRRFTLEVRSVQSRLGQYLLINSDGESWLPDEHGRTVSLGLVAGREEAVLAAWADVARRVRGAVDLAGSSLGQGEEGMVQTRDFVELT